MKCLTSVSLTVSIVREDYMMCDHHNSQGKKQLTYLIAERVVADYVTRISGIPVTTHAMASPSFVT
jgi:hypothetical protein